MISNGPCSERIAICMFFFSAEGSRNIPRGTGRTDFSTRARRRSSIFNIRYSVFDIQPSMPACRPCDASCIHFRYSSFDIQPIYLRGDLVTFVWEYCTHQLIVLGVTDFFLILLWWLEPQAPTDHLHEELLFPVFVAPIGIVMQVCVPAASHAPPLGVQAWATNLPPFAPPRGVRVFVPPR